MRARAAQVEADLAALKRTAERAGSALACLFASSEEFEAENVRARRAREAGSWMAGSPWRMTGLIAILSFVFLMM